MTALSGVYGFLGYGNMGSAIAAGLLSRNMLVPSQLLAYDPDPNRMAAASGLGIRIAASPEFLAAESDTLLLAIKPQAMDEALAPIVSAVKADVRVLSIMAGVSIAALRARFGAKARILRIMPNTPALVGAGAAALAPGEACSAQDIAEAQAVFEAVGIAEIVPESYIDAVTALSGSGPAYFFYLTECLAAAATAEGLPEALALRLAAHTLLGAGKLLTETGKTPSALREQVTSKGGTTFAALESLRARNYADIVGEAYRAAAARSRELGK